jgi:hypothetical protein
MKTRRILLLALVALGAGLGLGALSTELTGNVFYELQNRARHALVLRDMFQYTGASDAAAYFQGRADAYAEASDLVNRANQNGHINPTP